MATDQQAVKVNRNKVARATFGGVTLVGRERYGEFVTSFNGHGYREAESYEVSFTARTFVYKAEDIETFIPIYMEIQMNILQ